MGYRAAGRAAVGEPKSEVEAAYDVWSSVYDSNHNLTRDLDAQVLRRQALPLQGADVLELGAGTGKNTAWLAEHARSVLALDLSSGMLARARERVRANHVRFERADLREPWPVPSASFDLVVVNLVLEHFEALPPFHAEAARALRPGGRLFLCELHPFRQRLGGQARFTTPDAAEERLVPAFLHSVPDYLNAGVEAGLTLVRCDEWLEEPAAPGAPPRLLSLTWRKR